MAWSGRDSDIQDALDFLERFYDVKVELFPFRHNERICINTTILILDNGEELRAYPSERSPIPVAWTDECSPLEYRKNPSRVELASLKKAIETLSAGIQLTTAPHFSLQERSKSKTVSIPSFGSLSELKMKLELLGKL